MPPSSVPPARPAGPSRLCAIGNFDGVHRGHQAVLAKASREAREQGLEPVVLTFDPHPAIVLGRTRPPLLTPLDRKIELIQRIAPALRVVVKTFDRELATLSPEAFAERVLAKELSVARVVVGKNFRYGHERKGDLDLLREHGRRFGFVTEATELKGDERGPWSSSRVRTSLAAGDLADANAVLGRPHSLAGRVVDGDKRGRQLGFPTANLAEVDEALPAHGVYAVLVDRLDGMSRAVALAKGVANIGMRPTLQEGPRLTIEAHLFDFEGNLYGARLRVHLVAFLRGERKFDGFAALTAQIAADAAEAHRVLVDAAPDPGASGAWF